MDVDLLYWYRFRFVGGMSRYEEEEMQYAGDDFDSANVDEDMYLVTSDSDLESDDEYHHSVNLFWMLLLIGFWPVNLLFFC